MNCWGHAKMDNFCPNGTGVKNQLPKIPTIGYKEEGEYKWKKTELLVQS